MTQAHIRMMPTITPSKNFFIARILSRLGGYLSNKFSRTHNEKNGLTDQAGTAAGGALAPPTTVLCLQSGSELPSAAAVACGDLSASTLHHVNIIQTER